MTYTVSDQRESINNIFFDYFAKLAAAPGGIAKLRELILQLAVQGKLAPQNPEDEPASVLLERIKAEKARLVKEGKIRKSEPQPQVVEDEVPYAVPKGWEIVRLGDVVNYNGRQKIDPKNIPKDAWLLELEDIEKDTSRIVQRLSAGKRNPQSTKSSFKKGDVLYGKLRPYLNKVIVADEDGYCTTEIVPICIYSGLIPKYLMFSLKSPEFIDYVNYKSYGMKMPRLGTNDAISAILPLPPLPEQHRIVEKVDMLMKLCDELESREAMQREKQAKLGIAAITSLTEAEDSEAFADAWVRLCNEFDLIFDTPENVALLRQAVLQLAVQGKLVPQNPEDEPASVLLERIKVEKTRLEKEGKIKKMKPLPPVAEEEMTYVVPKGWEWVRLGELGEFLGGSTPSKNRSDFWNGDIPWVSPKDMKTKYIHTTELMISKKALENSRLRLIPKNSILIVARSGILKRILPVSINKIECTVNQDLKVIIPYHNVYSEYVHLMLKGHENFILQKLVKGGMTVQSLKYSEFELQPFPLPPLAEQQRIIEKVDTLMKLCDKLEAQIQKRQDMQIKLIDSVVAHIAA